MKKFLTATLSLVMLFTVSITPLEAVNAAHVHNDTHVHETTIDSIITPFAQVCGNCDRGVLIETKDPNSKWVRTASSRKCKDGKAYGVDLQESKTTKVTYKCNVCKAGGSYTTTEYRWVCNGFN